MGLILGQGTKIPHAMGHAPPKKKKKKKNLSQKFQFTRSVFVYNQSGFVELTKPPKTVNDPVYIFPYKPSCIPNATQKTHLENEHS